MLIVLHEKKIHRLAEVEECNTIKQQLNRSICGVSGYVQHGSRAGDMNNKRNNNRLKQGKIITLVVLSLFLCRMPITV